MNHTHYALFNSNGDLFAFVKKDFPANRMVRAVEDEFGSYVNYAYLSEWHSERFFESIACENADIPYGTEISYDLDNDTIVTITVKPAWEY